MTVSSGGVLTIAAAAGATSAAAAGAPSGAAAAFFSGAAAAAFFAGAAAAAGAEPAAGADPKLVIKSLMSTLSKALAKRPGQNGATLYLAAFKMALILSSYINIEK